MFLELKEEGTYSKEDHLHEYSIEYRALLVLVYVDQEQLLINIIIPAAKEPSYLVPACHYSEILKTFRTSI
jgi:hypothetical protein